MFLCALNVEPRFLDKSCMNIVKSVTGTELQSYPGIFLGGKLHEEMMARRFIDLNWDIFLFKRARELGFVSGAAQKFVWRGSDHHKTMSVLNVAHIKLWKEKLIPCQIGWAPVHHFLRTIICTNRRLRLAAKITLTTTFLSPIGTTYFLCKGRAKNVCTRFIKTVLPNIPTDLHDRYILHNHNRGKFYY